MKIREYLLDPAGGNNNNLFTAVPKLPLPAALKQLLLFNVDVTMSGISVKFVEKKIRCDYNPLQK